MRDRSDHELERRFALDAESGPARPVDDPRAAAIIAGALGGAGFPPPTSGSGPAGAGHAATGAKAGLAIKLAIVAGGLATVAAVAWIATRPPRTTTASPPPAPALPTVAPAPAAVVPPSPPEPAPAPAPVEPAAIAAPATSEVPAPRHAHAHAPPASAERDPEPGAEVDDLLARANAARAARDWKGADALYARVVTRSPAGLAGQTALVASATLHLEHLGDPSGAERRFRRVLALDREAGLAEDARWGLVECAKARADAGGERKALEDFLAHHASSPIAPRARARLIELGSAP